MHEWTNWGAARSALAVTRNECDKFCQFPGLLHMLQNLIIILGPESLIGENVPATSFPNCPNCCGKHVPQLSLVIIAHNLNCSGRGFVQ